MRKLFLVRQGPGKGWVPDATRKDQPEWQEHADFLNPLAARGFILLGGPVSETEALLVVEAPDEDTIRTTFAMDPWHKNGVLQTKEIVEWTILLEHGVEHSS